MQAGKNIKAIELKDKSSSNPYPCYGGNGIRGFLNRYSHEGIYPIVGRQGALCGNINIAEGKFYATEHAVVTDYYAETNPYWAAIFLEALNLNKYATATAQPGLAVSNIIEALFPLCPIREQQRITQCFNILTEKISIYDIAQTKLIELNSNIEVDLKKSILQEAIQGRLVTQCETDEPASVLLEKIRAEKEKLVKGGKLKKSALEDSVIVKGDDNKYYENLNGEVTDITDQIPFDIPNSWQWVQLEMICSYIQRGKSPKYSPIKKFPVVAQKCNQWSGFSLEKAQFIDPHTVPTYQEERILQNGDLLWNSTGLGTLGRMAIYQSNLNPYGWAVADSHVTVIRPMPLIINEYLFAYFASSTVQSVIEDKAEGSTKQKELATRTIKGYYVPLPPTKEQERIVQRIRMLFQTLN